MTEFEARLQQVRARFAERARVDADAIEAAAAAKHWSALRDLSHSICGRAGMFGYSAVSGVAKELETALDAGEEAERLAMLSHALVSELRELREQD